MAVYWFLFLEPQKNFDPILNQNIDKSPTLESLLIKTIGDSVVYLNSLRVDRDKNVSSLPLKIKLLRLPMPLREEEILWKGLTIKMKK